MFEGRTNVIATMVVGACLAYLATRVASWGVIHATWTLPPGAGSAACRAATGACWAVVHERCRFIMFGAYPFHEQWRPALVCQLFVALYAASAVRAWWKPWLLGLWIAVPIATGSSIPDPPCVT